LGGEGPGGTGLRGDPAKGKREAPMVQSMIGITGVKNMTKNHKGQFEETKRLKNDNGKVENHGGGKGETWVLQSTSKKQKPK